MGGGGWFILGLFLGSSLCSCKEDNTIERRAAELRQAQTRKQRGMLNMCIVLSFPIIIYCICWYYIFGGKKKLGVKEEKEFDLFKDII